MLFSASDEEYQHSVLNSELLSISFVNTISSNVIIGGSKGGARDAPPRSKFLQFHAVFGENWQK